MPKTSSKPKSTTEHIMASTKPLYIRNYPEQLCHEHVRNNFSFSSISFRLNEAFASFLLPTVYITESTRYNLTLIPKCVNIALGNCNDMRKISISEGDGKYKYIKLTNQEIWDAIQRNRAEYKASISN